MSLFTPQSASLNDIDGTGFSFTKRTVFGKQFKGVFFVEDETDVEALQEADDLVFSGPVYYRRRTQKARKKQESFPVEITNIVSVAEGERVDFVATEAP